MAASYLHLAHLQAADWSCWLCVQVSRAVVNHRSVDAAVLWRIEDAEHLWEPRDAWGGGGAGSP